MKKYPYIALLIFWMFSFSPQVLAQGSILLLGDSISAAYRMTQEQGWVSILNKQLASTKANFSIINASISGETTSGGLARLPGLLAEKKVDHLIIELGGNDGLRGYNPKAIKHNLLQMIEIANTHKIPVSIMQIKITLNYGPRYNKMFEQVFQDVARETSATLLPFFMEQVALDPELMMKDGIHPNEKAQPIIANYMLEHVKSIWNKGTGE